MNASHYKSSIYLKSNLFYPITLVCLISLLLGFIHVNLSTATGVILSFWIIMRARPDGILGLFFLYFSINHFFSNFSNFNSELIVFGLPFTVAALVSAFVTLRVILEIFFHPRTFKNRVPHWIIAFWLIAFIPVTINLYLGSYERNPNWTLGMRMLMISSSYFYGYILAKNFKIQEYNFLKNSLIPLVIILLSLHLLGLWWMHLGWLFLALAGSYSIYYIRYHSLIIGLVLLFLTILVSIQGSFTTMIIGFFAIFLSYISNNKYERYGNRYIAKSYRKKVFSNYIIIISSYLALFGIVLLTFGIAWLGYSPEYEFTYTNRSGVFGPFLERIEIKLFHDRIYLWGSALRQILSNPLLILPSGRPILVDVITWSALKEWNSGVHNVILGVLRNEGVIVGPLILIIFFVAIKKNFIVLYKGAHPIVMCLSSAVISVGTVGVCLGDFPARDTVGFFLWCFAGLAHGIFLKNIAYNQYIGIDAKRSNHVISKK